MFATMLALRLGTTPSSVLNMPNTEFNLFLAHHRMSPIGDDRGDLQAGIIAAAATNVHLAKKDRVGPDVFMPKYRPKRWSKKRLVAWLESAAKRQE